MQSIFASKWRSKSVPFKVFSLRITIRNFGLLSLTISFFCFIVGVRKINQQFPISQLSESEFVFPTDIDRSTCCLSLDKLEDICGRPNCIWPCPPPVSSIPEADQSNPRNGENAFFLETRGNGELNIRQACSVESLAFHNPNLTVYVLFAGQINTEAKTFQILSKSYQNIRLIQLNLDDFLAGTPLEHWYHCTDWRKGPYHVAHLSDGLRLLTVYKYGGYYFDLDIILTRSITKFRNFIASQDGETIANGAFHADLEHPILQQAVKNFSLDYRPDLWTHNGPDLLLSVLKNWCREDGVDVMDYVNCQGFNILPKYSFYPIHYGQWKLYFVNRDVVKKPFWHDQNVIGVHVWNKMSSKHIIYKNSNQLFSQIARDNCPLVMSIAPDSF